MSPKKNLLHQQRIMWPKNLLHQQSEGGNKDHPSLKPSAVEVAALPVKQGRKRKPVMPGRKAEATSVNNDKPSDTEVAAPAPNLGRKPRTVLFENVVAPVSKHVGAPSASSQQDNSPQFCKSEKLGRKLFHHRGNGLKDTLDNLIWYGLPVKVKLSILTCPPHRCLRNSLMMKS